MNQLTEDLDTDTSERIRNTLLKQIRIISIKSRHNPTNPFTKEILGGWGRNLDLLNRYEANKVTHLITPFSNRCIKISNES